MVLTSDNPLYKIVRTYNLFITSIINNYINNPKINNYNKNYYIVIGFSQNRPNTEKPAEQTLDIKETSLTVNGHFIWSSHKIIF